MLIYGLTKWRTLLYRITNVMNVDIWTDKGENVTV